MHPIADFRSDKCAMPTPEMLEAMSKPRWGDGQYDDGPTVHELEEMSCELTGKTAAVFVTSGIMANQLAVKCHTNPGEEIILDENCHMYLTEGGSAAAISGVQTCVLPSNRGLMDLGQLDRALNRAHAHAARTLVCTENTHNFGGAVVVPMDYLKEIRALATKQGTKVHLDGARINNASVKSGISVADYAATADSVMFCLSKGLCAPVGSVLCGDGDFIKRARAFVQRLGARPKQAAPLAMCGILGLRMAKTQLAADHATAARLGVGLAKIPGIEKKLAIEEVETNMVFATLIDGDAEAFLKELSKQKVLAYHIADGRMRFVTHRDVDADDVDRTVDVFKNVLFAKGS